MSGPSTVTCPCCGSADFVMHDAPAGWYYCHDNEDISTPTGCSAQWNQSRRAPAAGDAIDQPVAWAVMTKRGLPQELLFGAPKFGKADREQYWNEQWPDGAPHRCVELYEHAALRAEGEGK